MTNTYTSEPRQILQYFHIYSQQYLAFMLSHIYVQTTRHNPIYTPHSTITYKLHRNNNTIDNDEREREREINLMERHAESQTERGTDTGKTQSSFSHTYFKVHHSQYRVIKENYYVKHKQK
jgi:hypothetical protein